MAFCALTVDQHKQLYKLIYKTILDNKTFELQNFTKSLYDKVFGATNNHDLALTYATYVPSYVSNLQTEDKEIRSILKEQKVDANELIDKIDEWENNIDNVQKYLGVEAPVQNTTFTEKELKEGEQRAQNKAELKEIMKNLFNLSEVQAEAVSTIYDMVSKTYAQRTGNSPSDFYKTLTFTNKSIPVNENVMFQNVNAIFETRDGKPIGFNYDTDKVARERFDISKLKKISSSGSDRDVYDLGNDKVLKIAKTARGLEQNIHEGDYLLVNEGVIPQVFERGLNYVVAEKVEQYNKKNKKLNDFISELNKIPEQSINISDEYYNLLEKYNISNIVGNYDMLKGDFKYKGNWGINNKGQIVHLDAGTFAGISLLRDYAGKKNLDDKEFREIYNKSKQLKKQYGDTDKNTMYQIVGPKTISRGKGAENDRRIENLNLAKRLDKEGKSQLEIFHQTGWEKVDGEWKTELKYGTIPEFNKIKEKVQKNSLDHSYNVTDIYKDSELEKYYPFVNNLKVTFVEDMKGMGEFDFNDPKKPFILLNKKVLESKDRLKYVLVHELQHYVQFREGNLTNRPNYQSTDEYVYDPAEIEANNAGFRAVKGKLNYESFTSAYQNATELEGNILYQKNSTIARAAVQLSEDGQAIIYALTNPNVSSPLHELAHVWEHYLTPEERNTILEWTGQESWTRDTSEQLARGFEAYLNEGIAHDFNLQVIFDRFREWLTDIYKAVFKFQIEDNRKDIRDFTPEEYQSIINKANKLKKQGKTVSEIYDETGMVQNEQGAWERQTPGVETSEIDIKLNNKMRTIYSNMLGTNFNAKLLEEENADRLLREQLNSKERKLQEDLKNTHNFTIPIPIDSPAFYGHLSTIQQAFLNKTYDKLISDGKLTEQQLREIVNSTHRPDIQEAGLHDELVDQVMFRVNHPELIEDIEYWKEKPAKNTEEYKTYRLAIREIAFNGNLENAVKNDAISPEEAQSIITYTGQVAPTVDRAIKEKIKERGEQETKVEEVQQKAEEEKTEENPIQEENINKKVIEDITKTAKELYNKKPNFYLQVLKDANETNFAQIMKEIAEQANDPLSYEPTLRSLGQFIVDKAQEMFPDAIVQSPNSTIESISNDIQTEESLEENKINVGDTINFKGNRFIVEDISFAENPEDNMYYLNDGSAKFANQITKVSEQELYNTMVDEYNQAPINNYYALEDDIEVKRDGTTKIVKGELTDEDSENERQLNYTGLKTLLERLKTKFNGALNYEILNSPENFVGRFKNGVVQINIAKYDRTTPFHEYLHPFIEVLKHDNRQLYINLAKELGSLDEGKAIIEEVKNSSAYKGLSAEEIGDEALVRYISKLAAQNFNFEGRRKKTVYNNRFLALIDKFKDWFKTLWNKLGVMVLKDFSDIPLTTNLQDIADMVSIHDMKFDISSKMDLFKSFEKYQTEEENEEKTYEEKILDRIKKKIPVLESTARQRIGSDILLKEVVALRSILKDPDPVMNMANYMHTGMAAIEAASMEFNRISRALHSKENKPTEAEIKQMANDLNVVKNLITFYKDAEDYFLYSADDLNDDEYLHYRKILDKKAEMLRSMKSLSIDITTEWLFPKINVFNEKIKDKAPDKVITKEKFKNSLYSADEDIDLAFYNLGSVSSSRDPYSAILRSAIFEVVEQNHAYETETLEDIKINYDNFLNKTGVSNAKKQTLDYYTKNYLRDATIRIQDGLDENKNPKFKYIQKKAFIQEYNYDLFDKDRTEFMENTKVFGETGFDATNQEHIDKLFKWDRENGKSVQVGTEQQKQTMYDDNNKRVGDIWVEVPVMKLVPGEKYKNNQYDSIKDDQFFQTLVKHYNEGNSKLGDNALKYGIVPQVSKGKNMFVDYKDKTAQQKLAILGKKVVGAIESAIAPKADEEQTTDKNAINLDGSIYKSIKSQYNQLLEEDDVDLILPETVAKFASASNLNALKHEINPLIDISKSLIQGNTALNIEARKVTKVTSDNKTIFDRFWKRPATVEKERVRLNKQLTEFIDDVMYGDSHQEALVRAFGRTIDLNKLGDNWAFLTALNNMAFNITGGVGNFAIGNVQSFIESSGGRYFKASDWASAEGEYYKNVTSFVEDGFRLKKSKITQLGIKYDAIQGEFRDKYGKKFVGNIADRYANADVLFFVNHIAEHQIQLTGFLAFMKATKVKTKTGEEISLYDAHIINKDGFLRLRDDVNWTKQDDINFSNTWNAINKRINGNYSSFDKTLLQRRWYGKIALIYRKYIYTGLRSRYGREYFDYELGNTDFGYYRKFFGKLTSDIKEYKFEAAKRLRTKEGWSDDEKYAFNKTMTELSFLAGTTILAAAIAKAESGDDDTSWAKATGLLYLTKLKGDIQFFTFLGASDLVRILQNPSAIMVTMGKYADFFAQLSNPTDTYSRKTGPFEKGELKLKAKFYKAFPIVRQAVNFLSPNEQLAYYNVLKKGS